MLQQVVLQAATPLTLNIDGVDPDDTVVVKSISGLDPADVTLFTGDFARDGGYYQGRRLGQRNLVFNLKLNPNYATDMEVSDIREMLYSTFYEPDGGFGDGLQVVLKDDRKPDRYAVVYTEKFPSEIFSRETSAQISTLSVEPYLRSVLETTASDAVGWITTPVTYDGTARMGLEVEMTVNTTTPQVRLSFFNGEDMYMNDSFVAGDIISISTVAGERKIQKNGVDAMGTLAPTSSWIRLQKGTHTLHAGGDAWDDGKAVVKSYSFRSAWWGI